MQQHNHSKSNNLPADPAAALFVCFVVLAMQSSWQGVFSRDITRHVPGESRGRRSSPVTNTADPSRRHEERNAARRNLWLPAFNRRAMMTNQTKTVEIESQIELGTPMIFPPGWQDSLLVAEQVEQVKKEISKTENDSNRSGESHLSSITSANTNKGQAFLLQQGTALVSRQVPILVSSIGHQVSVKPGAIAYIVNLDKELAVYKLAGKGTDSISIKSPDGKHIFNVSKGTAIFISEAASFSESKLSKFIACKDSASMASENGLHVYSATFSYMQALDLCPQFQNCVASKTPEKHELAEKLLKLSAARLVSGANL